MPSRMYIAILDEFPDNMVPTLVAHSVLAAHMEFVKTHSTLSDMFDYGAYKNPDYIEWVTNDFRKCTVRVNQKEFDKIAALPNVYLGHENRTLEGKKACAVVCPYPSDADIPNVLKYAKLWTPKESK